MILARRLHVPEFAPAAPAARPGPAALVTENAALRARVAELEALLAAATEPAAARKR